MVKLKCAIGPHRRARWARALAPCLVSAGLLLSVGCGLVPKSRLDECHRVSQTLRAENNRLKDVALDLRAQNQDLSQRAVDDARRLSAQDEAIQRMESSVLAYQTERDKLAEAFEVLKRQIRLSVEPNTASDARSGRLKTFAETYSGWAFDPSSMTLSASIDQLFDPGRDRLTSEATKALQALSAELAGAQAEGLAVEIVCPTSGPPVLRAGFDGNGGGKAAEVAQASGQFLGMARAARVRERLVSGSGLNPSAIRLKTVPVDSSGLESRASGERRIEIRLTPNPDPRPVPMSK
jgi:chemotaxis protein MotB